LQTLHQKLEQHSEAVACFREDAEWCKRNHGMHSSQYADALSDLAVRSRFAGQMIFWGDTNLGGPGGRRWAQFSPPAVFRRGDPPRSRLLIACALLCGASLLAGPDCVRRCRGHGGGGGGGQGNRCSKCGRGCRCGRWKLPAIAFPHPCAVVLCKLHLVVQVLLRRGPLVGAGVMTCYLQLVQWYILATFRITKSPPPPPACGGGIHAPTGRVRLPLPVALAPPDPSRQTS
jgi:hypothetical protein